MPHNDVLGLKTNKNPLYSCLNDMCWFEIFLYSCFAERLLKLRCVTLIALRDRRWRTCVRSSPTTPSCRLSSARRSVMQISAEQAAQSQGHRFQQSRQCKVRGTDFNRAGSAKSGAQISTEQATQSQGYRFQQSRQGKVRGTDFNRAGSAKSGAQILTEQAGHSQGHKFQQSRQG